ncbi:fungal-specific transcription factor domain-containing protein [Tricladium varicosporioides]|nr:fungal-specific transcription factor domain-containing protein [Hymenoscyphus varicosporioides]
MSTENHDSCMPTASKRRRIALACSPCRARKSRCDGARPTCSGCEELGFECVYVNPTSSTNVIVGKEYLSSLEERLKAVEQDVTLLKVNQTKPLQHLRFEGEVETRAQERTDVHYPKPRRLRDEEVEVNSDYLVDSSGPENGTDGMGAIMFSAEEDCGFFGPSSNIAFTRHISRAMAHTARVSQFAFTTENTFRPEAELDNAIFSISQPPSPSKRIQSLKYNVKEWNRDQINIYALPSESATRALIEDYFGDTGLLFPYIHEKTFWDTYNEIKNNEFTKARRTWLGLLNMIMALATSTKVKSCLSAEKRTRESEVFYQRATGLCERQIMRGTSLETVQYLLLTCQYLQGTQRSVETWTIHGLAVKAAFQLGLHSTAGASRFSPLDQEIRKRTWYGCVVLDRTLSMTFGRPAAIPEDYVRIPLPQALEPENGTYNHQLLDDSRGTASVMFFAATITLYKIMWNVINLSYGSNVGFDTDITASDTVSRLFSIEQQLVDWERLLPPILGLREVDELNTISDFIDTETSLLKRFRTILALRYYNLRVLLHRPILVKFLNTIGKSVVNSDMQEVNLMQQIGSNSIQICVQSSMKIITIVSTIVSSNGPQRTYLGAWWFSLYYTFNAALVVFATLLIVKHRVIDGAAPLPLPVSETELQASLGDAARALRRLDCENRMVDKCAAYLNQLASVLETLSQTHLLFLPFAF